VENRRVLSEHLTHGCFWGKMEFQTATKNYYYFGVMKNGKEFSENHKLLFLHLLFPELLL